MSSKLFFGLKPNANVYHCLQSVTKIVRLAPPLSPYSMLVAGLLGWSFLDITAWHSFSTLGTTFNQEGGRFLGIFEQVQHFLGLFHENIVSLNNFCD